MPDSPQDYPNHNLIAGLEHVHFDNIPDTSQVIISMPVPYFPDSEIPPQEVQDIINRLKARGQNVGAFKLRLWDTAPCHVCNQDVVVLPPASPQDGFTRICWDCIEEQEPGFIKRTQEQHQP